MNRAQTLPRVTIVTPSFQQGAFLEQAIESVLGQDYPDVEYIVMDGGSTDGSVDIIRRHEGRLAGWVSERDGGQAAAINRGFGRATGEIFAWLNSDDLLTRSAVRIAVDALSRRPEAGVVYGDRLHIDANGMVKGSLRLPSYSAAMFRRDITLPQETVFFRRTVFTRVGGLDESLRFSLDFDLWVRMSQITTMHHVPEFMGCFREHARSKSLHAHHYGDEHERVYRRYFDCGLPGAGQRWLNRLWYRGRLAVERRGRRYRAELAHVRKLAAGAASPADSGGAE